jgi:hypothetical protein
MSSVRPSAARAACNLFPGFLQAWFRHSFPYSRSPASLNIRPAELCTVGHPAGFFNQSMRNDKG